MRHILVATMAIAIPVAACAADWYQPNPNVIKGPYLGASVTQARFDNNFSVSQLDRNNTRWKGELGWRVLDPLAFEVSYIDFGKASAPPTLSTGAFSATAHAIDVSAIGIVPLPYLDLFGRVGAARVTSAAHDAAAIAIGDRSTKFSWGGGVQWNYHSLGVRGEYQKFDTDRIGKLNLASLGVTWTFSPPQTH
jgi:hypothetical protein